MDSAIGEPTHSDGSVPTDSIETPSAVDMKACAFCGEQIRAAALVCRYCRSALTPGAGPLGATQPEAFGAPQRAARGATDPAGLKAMAIGGFVVLALSLLSSLMGPLSLITLILGMASWLLLWGAELKGAPVWRMNRRVPAWVFAVGLFVAVNVLLELLWVPWTPS
jgi:hypothetical protein